MTEGPAIETARTSYLGAIQPRGFPALPKGWVSEWEAFGSNPRLFSVIHHADVWKSGRALVIVHGLFEHGGRYLHFPHYLEGTVDAVCCLDLRGHGRSEGLRGHVDSFAELEDDVRRYLVKVEEFLKAYSPRHEIHLFGHSLGALLVARVLGRERGSAEQQAEQVAVRSATLSAPLFGISVKVPLAKRLAAAALSRVWGNVHLLSELDPARLSHDQEVADAYLADRLVHQKVTPRFYQELQKAMASAGKSAARIGIPLQVLLPLQDQIVDTAVVRRFYRELRLVDKELKTYPGFFHESFNEIGKEKVFEDLRTWIMSHSAIS